LAQVSFAQYFVPGWKGVAMEAVRAYFDGQAFVPVRPLRIMKNQKAIITILDDTSGTESPSMSTPLDDEFQSEQEMKDFILNVGEKFFL
jgi:hypothetical protein